MVYTLIWFTPLKNAKNIAFITEIVVFPTGEKLLPSEKYSMTEAPINDYSWEMNLTIRSLDKNDFVRYICSSENALGKAEGDVRLQGTHSEGFSKIEIKNVRYANAKIFILILSLFYS